MKTKSNIITLEPSQAAMVFELGQVPYIVIPNQGDDLPAEENVILCLKLALALQDKEIMELINKRFEEVCEKEMKNENLG